MRRILASAMVLLAAGAFLVLAGGASNGSKNANGTYTIQLDNAFGLVTGADFKVAGVRAGTIKSIDLPSCAGASAGCGDKPLNPLIKVEVNQPGFGQFHSDATCQSRPQSLIGEYFVECQPGSSGPVLKPGSVIPVSHTQTTIAADLLNNIMRMPYRQRFSLIINELGAGVAGRSGDLQAALRRAVPALTQTDNLLKLLADDSHTLQSLTVNSDSVITALANNSAQVQRFIVEANNAATDSATRRTDLQATFHKLPAFLEQLRPAMQRLGQAADANVPVLNNLNASSGNLARLLNDLVPFSGSSKISLKTLGQASVTGTQAAKAATPTVGHLNAFAKSTPELGQNLAIVLHDLDDRGRAVEKDTRSPGGAGYTGLEALLQYVYNQTLAINTFSPFGHQLTVDAFIDPLCAPYATPGTIAASLKQNGAAARRCYAWLGPQQPGINVKDPSNPNGACPDPGGAPPLEPGPPTTCAKLAAPDTSGKTAAARANSATPTSNSSASGPGSLAQLLGGQPPGSSGARGPSISLKQTLGQLLGLFGGANNGAAGAVSGSATNPASAGGSQGAPGQTQQLLNYLLAP